MKRPLLKAVALAFALLIPTGFAQVLIGTAIYRLGNPQISSVGFWGAAEYPVCAVAATLWLLTYLRERQAVLQAG